MDAGELLEALRVATLHRLSDIDSRIRNLRSLHDWSGMTFAELQATLLKRLKVAIPVSQRDEWERWFGERQSEAARLAAAISDAESEINQLVYKIFGLTPTEVDAVEDAIAIASPALTLNAYEAISAVEGLELTESARQRLVETQRRTQSTTNVAA
jgi:hypothetical protein